MRYHKIVFIIISFFVISGIAFAQNDGPGNTGLSFLKIGVTSRSIALGEAVVSSAEDASSTFYNPAMMSFGNPLNISLMHHEQTFGIRTEFLGSTVKLGKMSLGLSILTTSVNDIDVREVPGAPIDKFNAKYFSLGLSSSYKINDMLSIGLTGKFLYEKIYIDNSSGVALDFGGVYKKDNYSIGASFCNIGTMSQLRNVSTKLPMSVRFGGAYSFYINKLGAVVNFSAEGYKVIDGGKFHVYTGGEFVYKKLISLRAGYQSGYEDKFITAGIGLMYKGLSLDYAFIPYKYSLGSSHVITLSVNVNQPSK